MTDAEIFNQLFSGGKITLPYLLKFTHETAGTICLINNNESISYNGEVYNVSTFEYTKPNIKGADGSLRITSIDNGLFEFVENADHHYKLEVIGLLITDTQIQPMGKYIHFYGSVSMGDDCTIEFQLGKDDRMNMIFTPYTYDTENNPGNA